MLLFYRSFVVLLKIDNFVISVQLNSKILKKVHCLLISLAIFIFWAVTFVKIYINLCVVWVIAIIIKEKCFINRKICTNYCKSIPLSEIFLISICVSEILFGAPLNRNSRNWRVGSIFKIKNLIFKVNIYVGLQTLNWLGLVYEASLNPSKK